MSVVRPEFGPTLPALLRARLGVPPAVTVAVLALLALGTAAAALARGGDRDGTLLVRRGAPAFTLLYAPESIRPVRPRPGEYARLEARGRAVALSVVVGPLPPPRGAAPLRLADLPIRSVTYADELRSRLPMFTLRDDGPARVNDAPGYELRFRSGPPGRRLWGHEILVFPDEEGRAGEGVMLSLRQRNERARLKAADEELVTAAKRAMRSFRFGTDRP